MASMRWVERRAPFESAIQVGCMCKIGLQACSAIGQTISVQLQVETKSPVSIGWQLFDPESHRFLREGEWTPLATDGRVDLTIGFPSGPGGYRIYVSAIDPKRGWLYARGERFLLIDTVVANEHAQVLKTEL